MGYTTVGTVAGMFPTFVRGTAQQKPLDTLIQQYIDDVAGEIDAVLTRRGFVATGLTNTQIQALLSAGALNICEMINRFGAAQQLGATLATFGVASARQQAQSFEANYERLKNSLDARNERGEPLASGPYDKYFDPLARTESAEPALEAIAGGDMDRSETPIEMGTSQVFGKFDDRGT
jgi:hypothetical protein